MNSPVAMIIFNRPENTERVFRRIAEARPPKLLVVADGPRDDHPDDAEKCERTRAIIERVDWDCDVLKNYSEKNLGCGRRPASGITWVFEQVESAIILEDDCVAHPSFFPFCDELLERYADDERIWQISGHASVARVALTPDSYVFSRYPACWGWATWRRAWKHHDMALTRWPEVRGTDLLRRILSTPEAQAHWREIFDRTHRLGGDVDYWDYQWVFAFWLHGALNAWSNHSLISNIGDDPDATHTRSKNNPVMHFALRGVDFPLVHPDEVEVEDDNDKLLLALSSARNRSPARGKLRGKIARAVRDPASVSRFVRKRLFPSKPLPYDRSNPLMIDVDLHVGGHAPELAASLAGAGELDLRGVILGSLWPEGGVTDQADELTRSMAGLRPDEPPVSLSGAAEPLLRPASCRVEETKPRTSAASRAIVAQAGKASPERPLVVATWGALTNVASAWLADPSIADRVVVVSSLGGDNDAGGYCGLIDSWAAYIVMRHLRYVQFPTRLAGSEPEARLLEDVPDTPLRDLVASRMRDGACGEEGKTRLDCAPVISLLRPDFVIASHSMSFDHWYRTSFDLPGGRVLVEKPVFRHDPKGSVLMITEVRSELAVAEFRRALARTAVTAARR